MASETNPLVQQGFNATIAYMYLNPELAADTETITYFDTVQYLEEAQIDPSLLINPKDFPEKFNIHLFLSQNVNAFDLYNINTIVTRAMQNQGIDQDSLELFLPVFQSRIDIIDVNTFKTIDANLNLLKPTVINIGSVIRINCSNSQSIHATVTRIDFKSQEFSISAVNDVGFDSSQRNVTYTLQSVRVVDPTRIAYIAYFRYFLTSPPSITYDTVAEFNYDLYATLYPDAITMTKEEAYISYLYYIGTKKLRIGKAGDIDINEENLPSVAPVDQPPATLPDPGGIETDIVRVRKYLDISADTVVSLHGTELFYTTNNDTRHSSDVRYNGLITEYAMKAYVDRKFDDYADMNTLNVTGEAAFGRNVYLRGESNIARRVFTNYLESKQYAVFSNVEAIGHIDARNTASFSSNVIIEGELDQMSAATFHDGVTVTNDARFESDVTVTGSLLSTSNLRVHSNVDFKGTVMLGDNIELGPDSWEVNNTSVTLYKSPTHFEASKVTVTGCNLVLNDNSLVINNGTLDMSATSSARLPHLEVSDTCDLAGTTTFKGPVTFHPLSTLTIQTPVDVNATLDVYGKTTIHSGQGLVLDNAGLNIKNGGNLHVKDGGTISIENDGYISLNGGEAQFQHDLIHIRKGDIVLEDGNTYLENGSLLAGLNEYRDDGVSILRGDLVIKHGALDVHGGDFVVSETDVVTRLDVELSNANLSVTNGDVTVAGGNINITERGNISAPSTSTLFIGKVETKHVAAATVAASDDITCERRIHTKDIVTTHAKADTLEIPDVARFDRGNVLIDAASTTFLNKVVFSNGLEIPNGSINIANGSIDITGNLKVTSLETSTLTAKQPCKFGSAVTFSSNVSISGNTVMTGPVEFRSPISFKSQMDVIAPFRCTSLATFDHLVSFDGPVIYNQNNLFKSSVVFEAGASFGPSRISINDTGLVVQSTANLRHAIVETATIERLLCTEYARLNVADFMGDVSFASNVTFHGRLSLTNNLSLPNGAVIADNLVCTDRLARFKRNLYVDDLIVASNISIQENAFIRTMYAESVATSNLIFTGNLFDIQNNMKVRNRTWLNVLNVDGETNLKGSFTTFHSNVAFNATTFFPTQTNMNSISASNVSITRDLIVGGTIEVAQKMVCEDQLCVLGYAEFLDTIELDKGYYVSSGTCTYDASSHTKNYGKVTMSNVTVLNNFTSCNMTNLKQLHVNDSVSVNGDVIVDRTLNTYNAFITNDITQVTNVNAKGTVNASNVNVTNAVKSKDVECATLKLPGVMTADALKINVIAPLFINNMTTTTGLCTLNGGLFVGKSLTVNTTSIFHEPCTINNNLAVKGNTTMSGALICEQNATMKKDVYIDGDLYLARNVDLQRDIAVNNMTAKMNLNVANSTTTKDAVVKQELRVEGTASTARIRLGGGVTGQQSPPTTDNANNNIVCSSLRVKDTAVFEGLVTLGGTGTDSQTLLKVNGKMEAVQLVQLSDARTKYNVEQVHDDEVFKMMENIQLKDFFRLADNMRTTGFVAQDFATDPLLRKVLINSGEKVDIPLTQQRQCRVVSQPIRDKLRISDGMFPFFEKGQYLVLKDGRRLRVTSCSKDRMEAVVSDPLGLMEDHLTVVAVEAEDALKIDQTQLLTFSVGMCSALYRRLLKLEGLVAKNRLIN